MNTPIGKAQTKSFLSGAASHQPIKRDINLISNKETQNRIARRGTYLLFGVLFALLLGYFGFAMPLMNQANLQGKAADAKSQAAKEQAAAASFNDLKAKVASAKEMIASVEAISDNSFNVPDLIDLIEKACPEDIILDNFSININTITLNGRAQSDDNVAQLLVNLQASGLFTSVRVESVTQSGEKASAAPASSATPAANAQKNRLFAMTAVFPQPEVSASPGASAAEPTASAAPAATAPAETAKGGDGQ